MRNSYKCFLLKILLFINIGVVGCVNNTNPTTHLKRSNISGQNTKTQVQKTSKKKEHKKMLLDVPIISQMPELNNGCEVTSLAMLLQYEGIKVSKMTLAENIKKDKTPLTHDESGNIQTWGDPNEGFVGDITGEEDGFGVYPKPMIALMEQYMPGLAVDLTNQPFEALLQSIDQGSPVIVWITIDFKAPEEYKEWEKDGHKIKATFDEHAVLLVGYNKKYCYINNPFNGKKKQKIKKESFIKIWEIMGKMAISYK